MSSRRRRLAQRRKSMGFTQEGLAERLGVDPTTIRRWENGETQTGPQPWLRPKLARYLQVSVEHLEELLNEPATDDQSAVSQRIDHDTDGTGLASPGQPNYADLLNAAPDEIVAYLHEQWHLLVRADNLFGPARVLRLVHEQIGLIVELLRYAHGVARASLLSLGAAYAESAAWLHEDAGDKTAAFWTGRALEWAHAADEQQLVAWALFRRSQQVATARDAAQAIVLARAALRSGSNLPDQMRASFTQQEAYGLALEGDETACQRALDEALQWAAPADTHGDARSGHGAFCTASYIELQRAKCWEALGCPRRAIPIYETALADLPPSYNRDRGYGLAQFAGVLVIINEPERAAAAAQEALAIARSCGSGRTLRRIRSVSAQLRPHSTLPCVTQLFDEFSEAEA